MEYNRFLLIRELEYESSFPFHLTRTSYLSTGDREQDSAGTRHPSCARIAMTHVCRRSVDFPPIFGPLRRSRLGWYSRSESLAVGASDVPPRHRSFGMYALPSPLPRRKTQDTRKVFHTLTKSSSYRYSPSHP